MKLKKVLLIDDDSTVNFISRKLIEEAGLAHDIIARSSAIDVLNELENDADDSILPELIFVDINMPGMNGWEFIEQFSNSNLDTSGTKIILLTSLINPTDLDRANNIQAISAIKEKPVSMKMLDDIRREIFTLI